MKLYNLGVYKDYLNLYLVDPSGYYIKLVSFVNWPLFLCTIVIFALYLATRNYRFTNKQDYEKWSWKIASVFSIVFMAWMMVMCQGGITIGD